MASADGEVESKVTILMPVYNGTKYLPQQLQSILSNPMASPIMIWDDASTDGSLEYLRTFAHEPRVKVYRNERNLGVIATIELLLSKVETEFFALADQDDAWQPNRLESSVRMLKQTGALLVYSDLVVVHEDLSVIHPSRWKVSNQRPLRGAALEPLVVKSPVTGCTIVASQHLLQYCLPFPRHIPMHDSWMGAVAAAVGRLEYVNESTVLYRQHDSNESGGASPYSVGGFVRRVSKHATGSLLAYSDLRLRHRVALLDGLHERNLLSPAQQKLRAYYSSSTVNRLLKLPAYVAVLLARCRALGTRNLITDILMTAIPNRNGRISS
jgi:glycosyltransferase involved in cell wall biosynthesis